MINPELLELVGLVVTLFAMAALSVTSLYPKDEPPPRWLPPGLIFICLFVGLVLFVTSIGWAEWLDHAAAAVTEPTPSHKTLVIEHGPCTCECPGEDQ